MKTTIAVVLVFAVLCVHGVLILGNFEDIVDLERRFVAIQTQGNQLTERAKLELTIERLRFEKEGVITCLEDSIQDNSMLREQIQEAARMIKELMAVPQRST